MHQRFNIQQLLILPTLYLCVLCLSEKKKQLLPYKTSGDWFYNRDEKCLLRSTTWIFE
jgi:hypothetical protein